PGANIATPNHFELELITGRTAQTLPEAIAAIDALRALGPNVVLVTSLMTGDTPADAIDVIACDDSGRYRIRTPKLKVAALGAGYLMACLFFAHYRRCRAAAEGRASAVASVFGILKKTAETGGTEMALIEAQDELVNPSAAFRAESL